ncbi:MAG: hypothetical protein WBK91_10820 [Alphaproteobacteria bacterium]
MSNSTVYLVRNPLYAQVMEQETGEKGRLFCDKNGQVHRADYVATSQELMMREPVGGINIMAEYKNAQQLLVIGKQMKDGAVVRPLADMIEELRVKGWARGEVNNAGHACMSVITRATPKLS